MSSNLNASPVAVTTAAANRSSLMIMRHSAQASSPKRTAGGRLARIGWHPESSPAAISQAMTLIGLMTHLV
jgi:hypothetical protein